jgi:hypothetical protein
MFNMTTQQAKEILAKNKVTKDEYAKAQKEGRITKY